MPKNVTMTDGLVLKPTTPTQIASTRELAFNYTEAELQKFLPYVERRLRELGYSANVVYVGGYMHKQIMQPNNRLKKQWIPGHENAGYDYVRFDIGTVQFNVKPVLPPDVRIGSCDTSNCRLYKLYHELNKKMSIDVSTVACFQELTIKYASTDFDEDSAFSDDAAQFVHDLNLDSLPNEVDLMFERGTNPNLFVGKFTAPGSIFRDLLSRGFVTEQEITKALIQVQEKKVACVYTTGRSLLKSLSVAVMKTSTKEP